MLLGFTLLESHGLSLINSLHCLNFDSCYICSITRNSFSICFIYWCTCSSVMQETVDELNTLKLSDQIITVIFVWRILPNLPCTRVVPIVTGSQQGRRAYVITRVHNNVIFIPALLLQQHLIRKPTPRIKIIKLTYSITKEVGMTRYRMRIRKWQSCMSDLRIRKKTKKKQIF